MQLFYELLPNKCFSNPDCLQFDENIKDLLLENCDFLDEKSIFFHNGYYKLWLDTFTDFDQTEKICEIVYKQSIH